MQGYWFSSGHLWDLRVKPGGHFSWIRNDENFEEYGKLVYGKENKVLSILKSYGMLASIIETKTSFSVPNSQ